MARYVVNAVARLDTKPLEYTYSGRGPKPYDPVMMLSVLMFAYMVGIFSSRDIEEALKDRVSFMFIANNQTPDHVSISRFRERALPFFPDYFIDFLVMAADDGMPDMESVFGDGTKIKANASLHHAYSYKRAGDITEKLNAEIVEIEARLKEDDGTLRDALQKELGIRTRKLAVVAYGISLIESSFMATHDEEVKRHGEIMAERDRITAETGREPRSKAPAPPADSPKPTAQANLTDPDSRVMPDKANGWAQGYNCQISVAGGCRLIAGQHVSRNTNDVKEVAPMPESIRRTSEATGREVTRGAYDNGYFSKGNVELLEEAGIDPFIAAGRDRHRMSVQDALPEPEALPPDASPGRV
jgi:transposase